MTDEPRPANGERQSASGDRVSRGFGFNTSDMLPVLSQHDLPGADFMAPDDPDHALGRTIARVDIEEEFATVYLTFADGCYLAYAARIDEDGVILVDRFCPPAAAYRDYWTVDELEGETGPPPPELAPVEGTGFHADVWRQAAGRVVDNLGWDEEGMQAYLHFAGGGYLTLAARAAYGRAFLRGYFSPVEPQDGEYLEFDLPDADQNES